MLDIIGIVLEHHDNFTTHNQPILCSVAAVSTSAVGGPDTEPRDRHPLSGGFATLLKILVPLLEQCTDVNALKRFLKYYPNPRNPKQRYIEHHVYSHAHTVSGILLAMFS